jgi:anion-transporting  ArsA/GET3 family ATPase
VVERLLSDPSTAFVLVTSPRRDAVDEARFFAEQLTDHDQGVEVLIVNRVHPAFGDEAPEGLRARAAELRQDPTEAAAAARLAMLYDNLADFRDIANGERVHLEGLRDKLGSAAIAYVPFLAHDVHDFEALGEVAKLLFVAPDGAE